MVDMTDDSRTLLIDWFDRYVNRYRDKKGNLPAALELKYRHSQRVAENARLIAQGLNLTPEKILMAEGCGLVHDIGRFPQYIRYESFHDADTVDHGQEGRRILEKNKFHGILTRMTGNALPVLWNITTKKYRIFPRILKTRQFFSTAHS